MLEPKMALVLSLMLHYFWLLWSFEASVVLLDSPDCSPFLLSQRVLLNSAVLTLMPTWAPHTAFILRQYLTG